MVNIEIDGVSITARDGAMVIEAADEAGIPIARFCYHKKLSVAANCRMCLVEVEKAAKPLPACATPVTEGMKVYTKSAKALDAQHGTMEFLLINHPLDCPICDQGGECDLQDVAVGFGGDHSRYHESKRVVGEKELGPLIATDMTRCIHCTRCVRFGDEIAGIKELGATGRGEHMEIGTYVERAVSSELSGNVIDLCPVGALTSKPFRYTARPWELTALEAVSPHDCVGANLFLHVRGGRVMRVLPRENEAINETWAADRDRYSYQGLASADRATTPLLRKDGEWVEAEWETALETAAAALKQTLGRHGAGQIGMLVSPSSTLEECLLAQKMMRALGSNNIDHRLRDGDFADQSRMPAAPTLGVAIEELELLDSVLLIGSNVRKEQPLLGHRLRKAAVRGGALMVINSMDYEFRFPLAEKIIADPIAMERALAGVARALVDDGAADAPRALTECLAAAPVSDTHKAMAERLQRGDRSAVFLGASALAHPAASVLRTLAAFIASRTHSSLGLFTPGANSAGAWLAGAIPHRGPAAQPLSEPGLDARAMLAQGLRAYLLLNIEPELDCADPAEAMKALSAAQSVVVLTPFVTDAMRDYADVILPVGTFAETAGTFVSAEGRWQFFTGTSTGPGEARPAWKVLRVLGNVLGLDGFDYTSVEEVRAALPETGKSQDLVPALLADTAPAALSPLSEQLWRLADVPPYAVDNVVRRAGALQATADAVPAAVYLNEVTAKNLGVAQGDSVEAKQGEAAVTLPVVVDARVAAGCVWIPAGLRESAGLAAHASAIEISKA
ncbi:MAG TPA: NADH-quinone oxidoreductase subunit G [Gammaproteobacteria bacterium]|nr:NADH-quinone oxidoreductase subunit G [Gammaproteobacteria bacterium]